jgi:hypothetical protein
VSETARFGDLNRILESHATCLLVEVDGPTRKTWMQWRFGVQ